MEIHGGGREIGAACVVAVGYYLTQLAGALILSVCVSMIVTTIVPNIGEGMTIAYVKGIVMALSEIAALVVVLALVNALYPQDGNCSGTCVPLAWRVGALSDICQAVVMGVLLGFAIVGASFSRPSPLLNGQSSSCSLYMPMAGIAFRCIAAPISEEIIFRGVVYGSVLAVAGREWATLTSVALFVMAHFLSVEVSLGSIIPLCLLGSIAVWLRQRSDALGPPIIFHSTYNAVICFCELARPSSTGC
jgi:membrane protease YdiL (CAAX protease family)